MSVHRLLLQLALVMLCLVAWGCAPSKPRSPYPPPDTLRMAEPQRHEFVQLFLQGRWCEAQGLFERSLEGYLMQDDFCAAAQNHILVWKLKQYININDDQHLEQADALLRTGRDCPELLLPSSDITGIEISDLPSRDRDYHALLDAGRFRALADRLQSERDQLYASVYGRKAALAAMQSGDIQSAQKIIEQTRLLDARQGWIVFLIQDWKIIYDMTRDSGRQTEIQSRIKALQELIQPCPF